MGFFKELKDDLSQAVNELLPEEEQESGEELVNTLDPEVEDQEPEDAYGNKEPEEWLGESYGEDANIAATLSKDELLPEDTEVPEIQSEELKGEEENDMEENVDLELLEEMSKASFEEDMDETEKASLMETLDELSLEETNMEEEKEQAEPRLKSSSAVIDDEVTVISKGTTINGSISSDGSLDIMGNITGDVECLGKLSITGRIKGNSTASEVYVNTERLEGSITSEGSIKIGLGTVIIGDIMASSGVIAGAVKGEIDVNGPIVVDSTAIIKGNIKAKSVQINNGAVIEGFCSLSYSEVDVDNIFE